LPTSVVLINLEGLFTKLERILAVKLPCLLFNSINNLLDDIKAISVPAKKAENKILMIMIV
jgi:hypothetical protein